MWGWGREREDKGNSFSGFSFSACIIYYFVFGDQSDGCDKQQKISFKLEVLLLKYLQEHILLHGHGD